MVINTLGHMKGLTITYLERSFHCIVSFLFPLSPKMQLPKKPKEQEHFTTKKKKKAISQDFIYLFIFEHQPQKLKNQIVTKI
jgi:hypothetical protein